MTHAADVYQGRRKVALLFRSGEGSVLTFLPKAELESGRLSTGISYSSEPIPSPALHSYFLNLLPEGRRLQALLDASRRKDDPISLLVEVGWDTVGDVAVLPPGAALPEAPARADEEAISQNDFSDVFHRVLELETKDAAVPGVQEKFTVSALALSATGPGVPGAILKLNPDALPRLVQNEAFFMQTAKAAGLDTAKTRLVTDRTGAQGLLVTRFDRVKDGRTLRKLHQEDACQLLDLPPAAKYDPSMREVAEMIQAHASAPAAAVAGLIRLYAFSWLIGNGDLHAKNISLLWTDVVSPSPAYDLLSTLPYPRLDQHMALKLDGKDDNFRARDFAAFGARHGVPERAVTAILKRLSKAVGQRLPLIGEIGLDAAAQDRLHTGIADRLERLWR